MRKTWNFWQSSTAALLLWGSISGASSAWAKAGPPLILDDPGTPGTGNWEIFVAMPVEATTGEHRLGAPLLDLNYGWGERIELMYEFAYVMANDGDEPRRMGLDQSTAGFKYRFLDREQAGTSVSIYPQFTFSGPGESPEINEGGKQLFVPVEAEQKIGAFEINEEVGYRFTQSRNSQWSLGLGGSVEIVEAFSLLGEVHEDVLGDGTKSEFFVNGGFDFEANAHLHLVFSIGYSPKTIEAGTSSVIGYAGAQFLFR